MKTSAETDKLPGKHGRALHPVTPLLLWLAFAVLSQALQDLPLLLTAAACVVLALLLAGQRFLVLLRRTRWILLSLVLLYAAVTPGDLLFPQWGSFSPAREGIIEGCFQLARLVMLLASLAVLLGLLARDQVIAALYVLLSPLRYLGVERERIAVRLALTLHYAELQQGMLSKNALHEMLASEPASGSEVSLPGSVPGWRDGLLLALALILLVGVLR